MPLNSENCRALTGEVVEQATAAPGEQRELPLTEADVERICRRVVAEALREALREALPRR